MQFTEIFVRRPVMATAINLVLLILGIVAYHQLELRHTPNVPQNELRITTTFPGANSLAIEHQVTKPLEDALNGIDGIKKISSTSQDSQSFIFVKFKPGQANRGLSQVRDRIFSAVATLPEGVKKPEIQEQNEDSQAIMYINFEDKTRSIAALTDYIHRNVEDRLRLVDGIASIGHFGNKMFLVLVKPDPALLVEHQVTVGEIVNALRQEKTFASGGEIEGITSKEAVVLSALVEKPEDFKKITVKVRSKGRITVGDIATVEVGEKPTYVRLRVNGQYMVGLSIMAKPQANPLMVAKNVHAFVEDLQKGLPSSMKVSIIYDATRSFSAAFTEMRHTLWEAIILVGIVVTLSLASVRAALFPMLTVPLCLIGSFALMWTFGFSINPVTLLALVLTVGLVVDDAIVVVENIHRHMENGMSSFKAALASMKEITFAVIVMTITLAAVYIPLVFQSDDSAATFREFAWTLAGSVIISGFVALTLTPALCGKFLKDSEKITAWEKLSHLYRKGLQKALLMPGKVCILLGVSAILGAWGFQRLPAEVIPTEDDSYIQGTINAENSVSYTVRDSWFSSAEKVLQTIPEFEHVMTWIWQDQWMGWGLILKPSEDRSRTSRAIIKDLRSKLKTIVGPQVEVSDSPNMGGEDSALKVIIQYAGDQIKLVEAVRKAMVELRKVPGFGAVMSEQAWEKPRLKVVVDRALAAELGVSISTIEDTLSTFLSGRKAADFNFQGLDYDVQVRAPERLRSEFSNLNTYFVTGAEGQWVPLGSLITAKEVLEPNQIKHYDRMRGAAINVTLQPEMSLGKAIELIDPIVKKHLPMDARYRFGGKAEQYREAKQAMWVTFGLALAFIYLVLAALFESFLSPFIVLLTVPLSIVGAVWAINFIGGTNNIYTTIGLVTLIGLITKHGILIVDFTNRLRAEQQALTEAILNAAESRLRPVLMTTFAMICGAIPLVLSVGSGAIAREHIGWIIIGGMITGTFFSLFVIPVVYSMVAKRRK
jgi:multidrug efflux pump